MQCQERVLRMAGCDPKAKQSSHIQGPAWSLMDWCMAFAKRRSRLDSWHRVVPSTAGKDPRALADVTEEQTKESRRKS